MSANSEQAANVANWVCISIAIIILLTRFICSRIQIGRFNASSYLIVLSVAILIARAVCNVYILKYGTVSDLEAQQPSNSDGVVLTQIQTGSILGLVARLLITTFYWIQCILLLLLQRQILNYIPWVRVAIRLCFTVIGVTYVAVILTTFLECRPLNLYWKIMPQRSSCVLAYGQLLVQCLSNIGIDLILLGISIPIFRFSNCSQSKKLRISLIFTLGVLCIIVNCIRASTIYADDSSQLVRSFWASIQEVIAAFVANTPTIYGGLTVFLRRRESRTTALKGRGSHGGYAHEMNLISQPPHEREAFGTKTAVVWREDLQKPMDSIEVEHREIV